MIPNEPGGYAFIAAIDAYSAGVAAADGFEIVHATLAEPLPWRDALGGIAGYLARLGRPAAAWCALELRSPAARSFDGFGAFNAEYHGELRRRGMLRDGANPIARTNVAPLAPIPAEVVAHAFSFTRPAPPGAGRTFVAAGAGELRADALHHEAVVRPGDRSDDGMAAKAEHVLATIRSRLAQLGADWSDTTTIDIYTTADPGPVVKRVVLPEIGEAARRGVHWFPAAPPVDALDFEMDARGVATEITVRL